MAKKQGTLTYRLKRGKETVYIGTTNNPARREEQHRVERLVPPQVHEEQHHQRGLHHRDDHRHRQVEGTEVEVADGDGHEGQEQQCSQKAGQNLDRHHVSYVLLGMLTRLASTGLGLCHVRFVFSVGPFR